MLEFIFFSSVIGRKSFIEIFKQLHSSNKVIASGIFGFISSSFIYKMRIGQKIEIQKLFNEIDKIFIRELAKK